MCINVFNDIGSVMALLSVEKQTGSTQSKVIHYKLYACISVIGQCSTLLDDVTMEKSQNQIQVFLCMRLYQCGGAPCGAGTGCMCDHYGDVNASQQ